MIENIDLILEHNKKNFETFLKNIVDETTQLKIVIIKESTEQLFNESP